MMCASVCPNDYGLKKARLGRHQNHADSWAMVAPRQGSKRVQLAIDHDHDSSSEMKKADCDDEWYVLDWTELEPEFTMPTHDEHGFSYPWMVSLWLCGAMLSV